MAKRVIGAVGLALAIGTSTAAAETFNGSASVSNGTCEAATALLQADLVRQAVGACPAVSSVAEGATSLEGARFEHDGCTEDGKPGSRTVVAKGRLIFRCADR